MFFLGWIENVVGKGENAGYQPFFPFPTIFLKGSFFRVVKSQDYGVKSSLECLVKGSVTLLVNLMIVKIEICGYPGFCPETKSTRTNGPLSLSSLLLAQQTLSS